MTETFESAVDKVEEDIRASRLMFMLSASQPLKVHQNLLHCCANAGVLAYEMLNRGVDQAGLERQIEQLAEYRDSEESCHQVRLGLGTIKHPTCLKDFHVDCSPPFDFVVSPYYSEGLKQLLGGHVLYIPGVDNGSALEAVESSVIKTWKFFPASVIGSEWLDAWKTLVDPGTFVIATGGGGTDPAKVSKWGPYGGMGVGSEFIKNGMIENRQWDEITEALRTAREGLQQIDVVFP